MIHKEINVGKPLLRRLKEAPNKENINIFLDTKKEIIRKLDTIYSEREVPQNQLTGDYLISESYFIKKGIEDLMIKQNDFLKNTGQELTDTVLTNIIVYFYYSYFIKILKFSSTVIGNSTDSEQNVIVGLKLIEYTEPSNIYIILISLSWYAKNIAYFVKISEDEDFKDVVNYFNTIDYY